MLVCHQAFLARHTVVEPYDLQYRFSADFDWCIRVMKKARTLHNTHLILIDYLDEGMTTRNHKASLRERFPYYGAPLWNSQYRSPSYLVYISCNHQEIKRPLLGFRVLLSYLCESNHELDSVNPPDTRREQQPSPFFFK